VPAMKEALAGISDEEIIALARFYEALPLPPRPGPLNADKARAGAALSQRLLCGTCHLPDYRGQQQVPRLAGQHEPYLLASMQAFRDKPGPGRDTIMAATLRGLSDGELAALAHHLATFSR
jgi:cytochrome c553